MTDDGIQCDVKLENAFKSYGSNKIIKGLNMNVPSGSIYGLLGPSGCGKTTLLQCILGTLTLDSGSIDLKANCLKEIGYMPQEICLEVTLTVKEMFEYYGSLYKMKKKEIESRVQEIDKFLQLPNLNKYITEISGGQSRRVSLAISILHDPKIIILDEPTVGIDPLLREEIWAEFSKMAKHHKKTIIITTHYIEEASYADRVGLMRKGILVEEGSPEYILNKHGTNSLEESFLKACCNQESNQTQHDPAQVQAKIQPNQSTRFENNMSLSRIKALLKKNMYMCYRDYVLLYTMFILPILVTVVFCSGVGVNLKDMVITVINEEVNLIDCPRSNTSGCIFDENHNQTMSCIVLNFLQELDYKFVEVENWDAGEMSLNIPNRMAFLFFPKNFTKELTIYIDDRENYANRTYAHITNENYVLRNQIKHDVIDSINHLVEEITKSCSYDERVSKLAIEFTSLLGEDVDSVLNSTITIFLVLLVFYYSSVFSSSIMMAEKMDGTFGRSMFAGVKILELLLSMFCLDTMIILVQMVILYLISFYFFENPIQMTSGLIIYVILMLTIGWIGFLCGLVAAVLTPTKIGGVYMVIAMVVNQFYLSGTMWPVEGQPRLVQIFTEFMPVRVVGHPMTNIALNGWTLDHPSLITGMTASFAYSIFLVLVLFILGKFRKDLWVVHK